MDISGIGEAMIEVLVKQKMLNSVADIYQLTTLQNQILLRKLEKRKLLNLSIKLNVQKNSRSEDFSMPFESLISEKKQPKILLNTLPYTK